MKQDKKIAAAALLKWFDGAQRDLPWRKTRDPYAIWLSETMLQQTQVETVKPYYHKFLQRFPTAMDLAAARLEEVLELWAGLGYYRRAKHLHAAAKVLGSQGGNLPKKMAQLLELPGVGRYTAAAVASIAFGEPVAVLDGNVARVLARWALVEDPINDPQVIKRLWVMADDLMASEPATARPGDFNQAMMELGAVICTPRSPKCGVCPLAASCKAQRHGAQGVVPMKRAKSKAKVVRLVTVVLVKKNGKKQKILICKRKKGGLWEEMWEFPTFPEALWPIRKPENVSHHSPVLLNWVAQITDGVRVRLGLLALLAPWRGAVVHQLTHRTLKIAIARGEVTGGRSAVPAACREAGGYLEARWVSAARMRTMAVASVTLRIAEAAQV